MRRRSGRRRRDWTASAPSEPSVSTLCGLPPFLVCNNGNACRWQRGMSPCEREQRCTQGRVWKLSACSSSSLDAIVNDLRWTIESSSSRTSQPSHGRISIAVGWVGVEALALALVARASSSATAGRKWRLRRSRPASHQRLRALSRAHQPAPAPAPLPSTKQASSTQHTRQPASQQRQQQRPPYPRPLSVTHGRLIVSTPAPVPPPTTPVHCDHYY